MGGLPNAIDVAALEVASESHIAYFDDFALVLLNFLGVFIGLPKIKFLDGLFLEDDQLQFRFFSGFVSFVFAMFVERRAADLFGEDVGEDLVLGVLELVVGLLFIWVGLHKFIIMGLDGFYWDWMGLEGKIGNFDNEPSVFGWGVGCGGFFLADVFLLVFLWLFIFFLLCGDGVLLSDIFRVFLILLSPFL